MDPLLASIMLWPVPWVPQGWAACDGSVLPINQYNALFALIGVTYGGNGTTNFMLPNFNGRIPVGQGLSPDSGTTYVVGGHGGVETVAITAAQLPVHAHPFSNPITVAVKASDKPATTSIPTAAINTLGVPSETGAGSAVLAYNALAPTITLNTATSAVTIAGNTGPTGSGANLTNMQPYLALYYIICTSGVFPSRP